MGFREWLQRSAKADEANRDRIAKEDAARQAALEARANEFAEMSSDELNRLAVEALALGELGVNHGLSQLDAARYSRSAALSGLAVLAFMKEQLPQNQSAEQGY